MRNESSEKGRHHSLNVVKSLFVYQDLATTAKRIDPGSEGL
jgi:hypothetical protein